MAKRKAAAEWKGGLPSGSGTFKGESGEIGGDYTFESRFGDGGGTNPEEMLGAAHASCFSMYLSGVLTEGGNVPDSIQTEATVQVLKQGDGFAITRIDLATVGRVPGLDEEGFRQAAQAAKEGCPVSKALASVSEMNVDARLESS